MGLREILDGIWNRRIENPEQELTNTLVQAGIGAAIVLAGSGAWTPVVRGSGTAGTYQILAQNCRYMRIGRRVWLDLAIQGAAVVTGGGTGYLQITGAPFGKGVAVPMLPQGAVYLSNVSFSAGACLTLSHISSGATSILYINESVSAAPANALAVSGVGANFNIFASICFETDDP